MIERKIYDLIVRRNIHSDNETLVKASLFVSLLLILNYIKKIFINVFFVTFFRIIRTQFTQICSK